MMPTSAEAQSASTMKCSSDKRCASADRALIEYSPALVTEHALRHGHCQSAHNMYSSRHLQGASMSGWDLS